ncbi:MAG: hypothetical protein ACTSUV_05270 [Candidatus Ranarchaeia archaeon]
MSKSGKGKEKTDTEKIVKKKLKYSVVHIDEALEKKILQEIDKMKIITAQELSKKTEVNIGVLKRFLHKLAEEGSLKLESRGPRLNVYVSLKSQKKE